MQFIRNAVGGDMPIRLRARLFVRNYPRRFARPDHCCGHPGEPGC